MNNMHKVVFIGPEKIHAAFSAGLAEKNWDFQVPVETIADFIDKIQMQGTDMCMADVVSLGFTGVTGALAIIVLVKLIKLIDKVNDKLDK